MRRKHLLAAEQSRRGSATGSSALYPTGGAEVRLEKNSANAATGVWYDVSTNANNGTATTASTLADFYFNAAGKAANEMVDLASVLSANDPTKTFTVTFWAKNESAIGDNCIIMSTRQVGTSGNGWKVQDFPSAVPNPDYEWVSTTAPSVGKGPLIPEGIGLGWAFLAFTWEPGTPNTVKGYKNGVLTGTVDPATFAASTQPLRLFRGLYSGNSWTGYLDTLRVYNRLLTVDELLRDYHAGKPTHSVAVTTENLVSQYMPSGQTSSAWTDSVGSNNMTGVVTDPPEFDGDDYYTIGKPADLNFTGAFTIEAWCSQNHDSSQGSERVVSKDNVGQRSLYMTMRDNTGKAEAGLWHTGAGAGAPSTALTSTSNYTNGDWHHFVVVNYGAGQPFQMWVDGVLEDEDATGGGVMQASPLIDWEVGRAQNSTDYLEGRCDTVRFYNAALSPEQIINNYQAGLPVHP